MKKLFLVILLIFGFGIRVWKIGQIPQMLDGSVYFSRLISCFTYLVNSLLLFNYTNKKLNNSKISLLSVFVFSVLPWSFEQGRIASQINILLLLLLILTNLLLFINKNKYKIILLLFYLCTLYLTYPNYLNLDFIYKLSISNIIKNILSLLSPEFFLFKNNSFWFGGVRDLGIMNVSLYLFLLIGLFYLINKQKLHIIVWIIGIASLTSINSSFPETKMFYLSIPFLSIIVANGLYACFKGKNRKNTIILVLFIIFYCYDLAQYFHYYTVHYSQQVSGEVLQIHEAF